MMRDMFYLRLLAVASSALSMLYYISYHDHPLWLNAEWKGFLTVINGVQLAILLFERTHARFTHVKEEYLHLISFAPLSDMECKRILLLGETKTFHQGSLLAEAGKMPSHLFLITNGIAAVKIEEKTIAFCRKGDFVGEMSFLSNLPAIATVVALEPLSAIQWNQKHLDSFLRKEPLLREKMQQVFNIALIHKLQAHQIASDRG